MKNRKRLIDANALVKDLELLAKHEDGFRKSVILGVIHTVKAQITVDAAEVVHGRWVHPKGYVVSNGFLCSVCGHEEASLYPINPRPGGNCLADEHGNFFHPPKINYCPNCGAKMDGDGNG